MTRLQLIVLFSALVLFLGLYLGFKTKPPAQHKVEQSRAFTGESTGAETLLDDARTHLSADQAAKVADLEKQIGEASSDEARIPLLQQLSGLWYSTGNIPAAGIIAEEAAGLSNADSVWSVAGGTFFSGLVASQDPKVRSYCADHAVKAFESAASLNPEKVEHRVNLALVYAENPPPDNPMRAVLLLRELESKHPDNPAVYNALGRLAIKTGQWERAIERLEKAWSLDKANPNTPCLLAKAYNGAGNAAKAAEFAKKCSE